MRRFTAEELAEIAAADAEDDKREAERRRAYYQAHKTARIEYAYSYYQAHRAERIEYARAYKAKKRKHERSAAP